jgi:hypothetical protein
MSTAACGLFQKDQLALDYPSENARPTGKTLLVWGGSTSVGSNAIQLAVAAGYQVITTASPVNFEYVKALGASYAVNYKSPTVVNELIEAFRGRTIAGAIAIGATSASACFDVVHRSKEKKFVSMASFPLDFRKMAKGAAVPMEMFRQSPKLVSFAATLLLKSKFRGISTKAFYGTTLMDNEVTGFFMSTSSPRRSAMGATSQHPRLWSSGEGLRRFSPLSKFRAGVCLPRR